MSRYVAGKRMKELKLVSCQMPVHRYKQAMSIWRSQYVK